MENGSIISIIYIIISYFNGVISSEAPLWPYPQEIQIKESFLTIDSLEFEFITKTSGKCQLLDEAIKRYKKLSFINDCSLLANDRQIFYNDNNDITNEIHYNGNINNLTIEIRQKCETSPYLNMDEMYTLRIDSPDFPNDAFLFANSIWGALRGLETFSQLIQHYNSNTFIINSTFILDYPRFSHRGLLIDTSRHYIPMHIILENLDAMSYNKLNVFHWHIVDDQSFPYVSKTFPNLSEKGSYNPQTHVYTPEDVNTVIEYARNRGIRVIVEFDTPGHALSWGKGQDNLLTKCYSGGKPNDQYGPIDPSLDSTYEIMESLFEEIANIFPDQYIHIGGDEVSYKCWKSNPIIQQFMQSIGIAGDYNKLEEYYMLKIVDIISKLHKNCMVYQEVIDNGAQLPNDIIVYVWKSPRKPELQLITKLGYKTVLSQCWYLDYISYGYDWYKYYDCDPRDFNGTDQQKQLIIGGEVSLWSEWIDGTNFISRTWPRASAAAERLWSSEDLNDSKNAEPRIVHHRCRMLERGLRAEPIVQPTQFDYGFCKCDHLV